VEPEDIKRIRELKSTPMVDGEHIIIKCSRCNKPLVDIWVNRPNAPAISKIVAQCPHCGDKSFAVRVSGLYQIGATPETAYDGSNMEIIDGVFNVLVLTRKV